MKVVPFNRAGPEGYVEIAGRLVSKNEFAGLSLPFGKQGPIVKAPHVADLILGSDERFAVNAGGRRLYVYRHGVYVPGAAAVERWTDGLLKDKRCEDQWTTHLVSDVVA